jgi:hypothetical protein
MEMGTPMLRHHLGDIFAEEGMAEENASVAPQETPPRETRPVNVDRSRSGYRDYRQQPGNLLPHTTQPARPQGEAGGRNMSGVLPGTRNAIRRAVLELFSPPDAATRPHGHRDPSRDKRELRAVLAERDILRTEVFEMEEKNLADACALRSTVETNEELQVAMGDMSLRAELACSFCPRSSISALRRSLRPSNSYTTRARCA